MSSKIVDFTQAASASYVNELVESFNAQAKIGFTAQSLVQIYSISKFNSGDISWLIL